jgi:hypothetical protein
VSGAAGRQLWLGRPGLRQPFKLEHKTTNSFTVIVSFALTLLLLALFKSQAGRIVFGVFFLLMAWGVNFLMMLYDPSPYLLSGANSFISLYRWFFTEVLALYPVPFILLLIGFEAAVGVLILTQGSWVRLGLGLGALFCLGIAWIGPEGVWMPAVAVAPLILLLLKHGGHPVFLGQVQGRFLHPGSADVWNQVGMVRYCRRRDLLNMAVEIAGLGIDIHKGAALKKKQVFPVKPLLHLAFIRVIVAALLFALALI